MRLTCPNCQETLSLPALIEHDAAREAVRLALEFPAPLGKQLIQYVGYFKPAKNQLSMNRFARIIGELLPMIKAAQIERNGRVLSAPLVYWEQAFETMWASRDGLILPLTTHGYLLKIIAGYADKDEGKKEKQAEQGRKYGVIDHVVDVNKKIEKPVKKTKSVIPEDISRSLRNRDWQNKGDQ